ncbi:MAG: DNA primase [Planctomycetes bacterium]|nr:DNA primase [Planctomycetota bacterium]
MADDTVKKQVKEATDIVDVASRYVRLKKSGKDYVALCPFHREKTPSFHINVQGQYYYCFGCGKKGDVFTLMQEMEGISFPEALAACASQAGIDIRRNRTSQEVENARRLVDARKTLYAMMQEAQKFYAGQLDTPDGREVVSYAKGRGLDDRAIEAFGLGYAPNAWETLRKYMNAKKIGDKWLASAGLARLRDDGSVYDYFRNRLMFPIRNSEGKVVGFGARALADEDEPKYLNSPETPIFRKGTTLFGLDRARRAISSSGTVIVCEGYTDVIMSHQAEVDNAVATLGTSLTREGAVILGRLAERVILVFDGDAAGQKACRRALEIMLPLGIDARTVVLPAGEDPASLVAGGRIGEFKAALQNARDGVAAWLDMIAADAGTDQGPVTRIKWARKAAEVAEDAVDGGVYSTLIGAIAGRFGIQARDIGATTPPKTLRPAVDTIASEQRTPGTKAETAAVVLLAKAAAYPSSVNRVADSLEGTAHPEVLRLMRAISDTSQNGFPPGREIIDQLIGAGETVDLLTDVIAEIASRSGIRQRGPVELESAALGYRKALLEERRAALAARTDKTPELGSEKQKLSRELDEVNTAMQQLQYKPEAPAAGVHDGRESGKG